MTLVNWIDELFTHCVYTVVTSTSRFERLEKMLTAIDLIIQVVSSSPPVAFVYDKKPHLNSFFPSPETAMRIAACGCVKDNEIGSGQV